MIAAGLIGSVLDTAAAANIKMPADKTFAAEILLGAGEILFYFASGKLLNGCLENIADLPHGIHKKIANKRDAAVLDNDISGTPPKPGTDSVPACHVIIQNGIEIANT
jgi:hypothetical protein